MKKYCVCMFLIMLLFTVTACGNGTKEKDEETGKEKTTFTCIKNGIETKDGNGKTYTMNIKEVAKVDEDGKLIYYSSKSTYSMTTTEDCEKACAVAEKWNNDINDKNYSGTHRVTTCNCNDKEYFEERIYEDIPNLDNFVRSDIQYLNDDNTFDLDQFISHYENYGYNCN